MSVPGFTVRTAITLTQQGLVETLDLALRRRFLAADFTALRAFPAGPEGSRSLANRELCFVASQARNYRFDSYLNAPDNGATIIAPGDRTGPGRWVACTLSAPYGRFMQLPLYAVPPQFIEREPGAGLPRYARAVQLYEGDLNEEALLDRIFAQRPSILIKWESDAPAAQSNKPGCLYRTSMSFTILCIAQNNRSGQEALYGSPVPADQQEGPGLNRMIGDVRYAIAGASLGLYPRVERVEIGPARIVIEDLAQRLFVAALDAVVTVSYHLHDEILEPVDLIAIQPTLAAPATQDTFPLGGYVVSGFALPWNAPLDCAPSPGAAVVNGQVLTYQSTTLSLPATSDVYFDLLPDGTLAATPVAVGAPPPPCVGVLRVSFVRTGADSVLLFAYLCPSLIAFGSPYTIPSA